MKINLENKYKILLENWEVKTKTLWEILSVSPKTILYFYTRDNSSGCSVENRDFSCMKDEFLTFWFQLVWVSKDSIESHKQFKLNYNLDIPLISDEDLVLHNEFWLYTEKSRFWKTVMTVDRSTFFLDSEWNILKEYRKIRAKNHVKTILKELKKASK